MPIIYNILIAVVEQDPSSSAPAAVDVKFSQEKYEKREGTYLVVRLEVTRTGNCRATFHYHSGASSWDSSQ